MPEGIDLPAVARGTLLPLFARVSRLDAALPQIRAALSGETDRVAIEATLACLLYETFVQASWCGFYRRTGPELLTVGPYQGPMGCLRIDFGVPVLVLGDLVSVPLRGLAALGDLDSRSKGAFSREEADRLAPFLAEVFC